MVHRIVLDIFVHLSVTSIVLSDGLSSLALGLTYAESAEVSVQNWTILKTTIELSAEIC